MKTRIFFAIVLAAVVSSVLALSSLAVVQQGNVWTVDLDNANHKGTQTTTVTVTYTDSVGKKQTKEIKAETTIPAGTTAAQKKALVQAKLDAALSDSANEVGGHPLASTGGIGDTIQVQPTANTTDDPPSIRDAKITDVKATEHLTGENDLVNHPGQSGTALGTIEALGDITGKNGDNAASVFSVITSAGVISVNLTAGMTHFELLDQLAVALKAQGASVWVDHSRNLVSVALDGDFIGLGAGCTDVGLDAVTTVMIQ
jgi:hypothetical protein